MKNNLKRVLSIALVMMLILSCVPTMAFAAEDSHAAQNITTGAAYATLAEAMAAATAGQTVKVLANSDETVTYTDGVILDLNGYNLTNVTVPAGVTLTAIDSATDDYAGSFGSLSGDIAGTVASTVKTAEPKSYVSINENGSWSFHRYYAAITAISLKPGSAALGYKAEYYGDEAVKNAVVNYGYEMWLNDYAHKTLSMTNKLEKNTLTLRLNNILKEGNDGLNAIGSTASINGKAFITLNVNGENVTLYSAEKTTTLRSTIEAINANVAAYSETALQAVRNLCTTFAPWMMGWATENIFGVSEGEGDLNVDITVPVTAENNVLSEDAVLSCGNIIATVPAGTQLADGTTKLKLTIVDKASSDSDVETTEDETLRPMDVHIEGISADNNAPIIICLGNVLPKGLNIGNYDLYHVEDGKTVPMTRAYTLSELDAHNEFHYDPATGAVTIAVVSFSEITLTNTAAVWEGGFAEFSGTGTTDDPYIIANADQLAQMSKLVSTNEAYASAHYKLISDLNFGGPENAEDENGAKYVFYPIGYWAPQEGTNKAGESYFGRGNTFTGTFDGNGNTISGIYQNTWLMDGDYDNGYWDAAMGLFGSTFNATIKNLTMDSFSSDGEYTPTGCVAAYAGGTSVFENITLTNCNPRVYNTANGGIVGLNYNSATAGMVDTLTFRNITVDQTNKITALWGSWDVGCGGILGRLRDDETNTSELNTATFENCHVSAIIDVYNDVCANYQYYQYRYCGMLIGTVDYVDLANFDLSTVITAKESTVTYGAWNEYWYCELVANSLASYTHDHQFSRLEKITGVSDIQDAQGNWTKAGNFVIPSADNSSATCYHIFKNSEGNLYRHFHNVADESNPEIYESKDMNGDGELNDLKEDRVCYYIPFGQLFTGYGWGSSMRDVFDGITRGETETVKSQEKFTAKTVESWISGEAKSLGTLFDAKVDETKISKSTLQVFVSPADESSTVSGVYSADTGAWQNGSLTITGTGKAKITITDYFYCITTTLVVDVVTPVVRFHAYDNTLTTATGNTVNLVDPSTCPTGYEFVGWSETPLAEETNKTPTIISGETYTPAAATTNLYAVYSRTETTAGTLGETNYTIVTDVSSLKAGDKLIIVNTSKGTVAGEINGSFMAKVDVTISDKTIANLPNNAVVLTLGGKTGAWTFTNDAGKLLGATTVKKVAWDNGNTTWSISIDGDYNATIQNNTSSYGRFLYNSNSGSERFTTYTSATGNSMLLPQLYRETTTQGTPGETSTYYITYEVTCPHTNTTTTTVNATCTTPGSTVVTCADCGEVISNTPIAALGHTWNAWTQTVAPGCETVGEQAHTCSVCGQTETETIAATGHNYNENNVCSVCGNEKATGTPVTDISTITMGGGFVIAAKSGDKYYALDTAIDSKIAAVEITVTNGILATTSNVPVWNVEASGDGIALKNDTHYLKWSGSSTSFGYTTDKYVWKVGTGSETNSFTLTANDNNTRRIALNGTAEFRVYSTQNIINCDLYLFAVDPCDHANATTTTVNATCTEAGYTQISCPDCNRSFISSETPALGHTTTDGLCSNCGETLATLSFASTAQRTSFSTDQQVWEQNGITFTNNKADSDPDVANYFNPVRLYEKSEVIITFTRNVNSIEFNCSQGAADLVSSINIEGATVTVSGSTVIVTLDGTSETVTIASLAAQIRLTSITVSYKA